MNMQVPQEAPVTRVNHRHMRRNAKLAQETNDAAVRRAMTANEARRRNIAEQTTDPHMKARQEQLAQRLQGNTPYAEHVQRQIDSGLLNDYDVKDLQKVWAHLTKNSDISTRTLEHLLQMEPEQLQKLLQREIDLNTLSRLVPDKKEFSALLQEVLHIYTEDKAVFAARWQRLEELLSQREPAVRHTVLTMSRQDLRDVLLRDLQPQTIRAIEKSPETVLTLRLMQVPEELAQRFYYTAGRMQEQLQDPGKRGTFDALLNDLNKAALFDVVTGKTGPHDLIPYFDRKDIWRIVQEIHIRRPTEEQLNRLPGEQRARVEAGFKAWDTAYAQRCVAMERAGQSMEQWWQGVLDNLGQNPKNEYRSTRGQLLKLAETNPLALERVQILLLDFRTPQSFTTDQLNQKLDMLQRLVAPEHFIPLMLGVVPKPEKPFDTSNARLPTFNDVIYSQQGIDIYTAPRLGTHIQYNIPFYISEGNLRLLAQSGGGKTTILESLMRRFSGNPGMHGRQRGDHADREASRKMLKAMRGEKVEGKLPFGRTEIIFDPKGGELVRKLYRRLTEMGYDVRIISFDNPDNGLLKNPLADIPSVTGPVKQLEKRVEKVQALLSRMHEPGVSDQYKRGMEAIWQLEARLQTATKDQAASATLQDLQQRLERARARLQNLHETHSDSYLRGLRLIAGFEGKIAELNAPDAVQQRSDRRDRAASEFARLWIQGIPRDAIVNASVGTAVTESHVFEAIKAAAIASREGSPQAPLFHLAEIVHDKEAFIRAIESSGSRTALSILNTQILPLDAPSSERLFGLLRDSTKTLTTIDSLRRLTSGNEMSSRGLVNGGKVVFVQCDYRRLLEEDASPVLRVMMGMMEYSIEQEKNERIEAGRPAGADIEMILEEFPKIAGWFNLEGKLGIKRDPANITYTVLGQDDRQISDEIARLISRAIYAYVSQAQAAELAPQLGTRLVPYKNSATSSGQSYEDQYRRMDHAIGFNSSSTDVYQQSNSLENSAGSQEVRELLLTPQQIKDILAVKGTSLYLQPGLPPMFIRVPLLSDKSNAINCGFDQPRVPDKMAIGVVKSAHVDRDREVWGRKAEHRIMLPAEPGEAQSLTTEEIQKMTTVEQVERARAQRKEEAARVQNFVADVKYLKSQEAFINQHVQSKDAEGIRQDKERFEKEIDEILRRGQERLDRLQVEIRQLDAHGLQLKYPHPTVV